MLNKLLLLWVGRKLCKLGGFVPKLLSDYRVVSTSGSWNPVDLAEDAICNVRVEFDLALACRWESLLKVD